VQALDPRTPDAASARPVICALDVDDRAAVILATARELARRLDAPLRVLHVREVPPAPAMLAAPGAAGVAVLEAREPDPEAEQQAVRALRDLGVASDELVVETGHPETSVLRTVAQERPCFAVAGTHERGALRALLQGSVSRALARDDTCPVVVVPPAASGGLHGERVLCAVSPRDDEAQAAIALAADLARRCSLRLVLAHVAQLTGVTTPEATLAALGPATAGEAERQALDRLRRVAPLAGDDVEVELEPRLGDPAMALVDAARASGAALVVTSTRGRGPLGEMLLGSVWRRLACEAPCPVAVVRASGGHG
jgi:nucleotide-binding universal stress UspA family protein